MATSERGRSCGGGSAFCSSLQNAASTARWLTPASSSRSHRIRLGDRFELAGEVDAEVAGIVGVHRQRDAGRVQGRERVGRAVGVEVDEVRAEAHVEGHRLVGEAAHELRVVDGADAVIDAVDVQQVERVADAVGAGRFPGVGRAPEAELAGAPVRRREPWSGAARRVPRRRRSTARRRVAGGPLPSTRRAPRPRRRTGPAGSTAAGCTTPAPRPRLVRTRRPGRR